MERGISNEEGYNCNCSAYYHSSIVISCDKSKSSNITDDKFCWKLFVREIGYIKFIRKVKTLPVFSTGSVF
jgi:hypothetical protein